MRKRFGKESLRTGQLLECRVMDLEAICVPTCVCVCVCTYLFVCIHVGVGKCRGHRIMSCVGSPAPSTFCLKQSLSLALNFDNWPMNYKNPFICLTCLAFYMSCGALNSRFSMLVGQMLDQSSHLRSSQTCLILTIRLTIVCDSVLWQTIGCESPKDTQLQRKEQSEF